MIHINRFRQEALQTRIVPGTGDVAQVASEICGKALEDAKSQLHPLLRNAELDRLDQRAEFLQAFKNGLEQRIARKLAAWQPGVQAVFKYEETHLESVENWDGSIRLLVKVPRLSNAVKSLGRKLDKSLVKYFEQLGWQRFLKRPSILEVHQVTLNELRHGVGYGAMFCAVYNVPIKVWPQRGK